MPQTIANIGDIDISRGAGTVQTCVISGFAQITMFGLTRQSGNDNDTFVEEGYGKIGRLYDAGAPEELIGRRRLVCHGRVFKTHGDSFNVNCRMQQDGREIGSCGVQGQFTGETVAFRIVCNFV